MGGGAKPSFCLVLDANNVVAPVVEDDEKVSASIDDGVVAVAEPVNLVHDPADLDVNMLGEPGEQFHQSPLKWPFAFGY